MVVAAERAGTSAGLAVRVTEPARRVAISIEWMGLAATVFCAAALSFSASRNSAVHVVCNAALTAAAVVIVAIVKSVGMGVVAVVVVDRVVVVPVESPMSPTPPEAPEPTNAEA